MKFGRKFVRRLYSLFLSLLLQRGRPGVFVLSPRLLKQRLGETDVLRIAAPGASVRASDLACGSADGFHVLGVNYFSECTDLRLWSQKIVFVIEPHGTYQRYIQSIRRAAAEKESCLVIVKGLGSPRKIGPAIRLVRELSSIPGATVLLSNDLYMSDLPDASYADAIVRNGREIVSGWKTLLWTLSFAYVAGYRRIVLHGFDFSEAYAYAQSEPRSDRLLPNSWVSDPRVRDPILKEVASIATLFQERDIQLLQCSCEGPLRTLLSSDPACIC